MPNPKKTLTNASGDEPPFYPEECLMKLDLNENIIGPSPKVLEAIRTLTENNIKFYPALGKLISKLAEVNNVDQRNDSSYQWG